MIRTQILERETNEKGEYVSAAVFNSAIQNEINNGWRISAVADTQGVFTEILMVKAPEPQIPNMSKMPPKPTIPVVKPPDVPPVPMTKTEPAKKTA